MKTEYSKQLLQFAKLYLRIPSFLYNSNINPGFNGKNEIVKH